MCPFPGRSGRSSKSDIGVEIDQSMPAIRTTASGPVAEGLLCVHELEQQTFGKRSTSRCKRRHCGYGCFENCGVAARTTAKLWSRSVDLRERELLIMMLAGTDVPAGNRQSRLRAIKSISADLPECPDPSSISTS